MANVKVHKVTALPSVWDVNAVYYVKIGSVVTAYVTDNAGTPFVAGTNAIANSTTSGLLSSTDWNTFNSKAPASGGAGYVQNQTAGYQSSAGFKISGTGETGSQFTSNSAAYNIPPLIGINSDPGASGLYSWIYKGMTPNIPTGGGSLFLFGKAESTNNSAYMAYVHGGGNGSANNYMSWSFYGNDNLMRLYASGRLAIGNPYDGGGDKDLLTLSGQYGSGTKKGGIVWEDAANITGRIHTEYDGGNYVDMVFGSLYSTGYNNTERMRLTGAGRLGIGTNAPTEQLHVVGNARANMFVDNTYGYVMNSQSGYTGFFTNTGLSTAHAVKMGSLVVAPSYAAVAPTNGIYSERGMVMNVQYGAGVNFHGPTAKAWQIYVGFGANNGYGVGQNISCPVGMGVAGGALRFFAESGTDKGFVWEAGTYSGNPTAVLMDLNSNSGLLSLANDMNVRGKVAIGNITATEKLHVDGSIRQSGVTSSILKADSNGKIVAATAGTDYLATGSVIQNQSASTQSATYKIDGTGESTSILAAPTIKGNTLQPYSGSTLTLSSATLKISNFVGGVANRAMLVDSIGSVTAGPVLASGTYTPTVTGDASFNVQGFTYQRIGDIVSVMGRLVCTAISASTMTASITLPIASNLDNAYDLTGTLSGTNIGSSPNVIIADGGTNKAFLTAATSGALTATIYVCFQYQILL